MLGDTRSLALVADCWVAGWGQRDREDAMFGGCAMFTYASAAPRGLPTVHFPQHLGAVQPGVVDLALEYDSEKQELLLVLALSDDDAPERDLIGITYGDLVASLVDHISFELGLPLYSTSPSHLSRPRGEPSPVSSDAAQGFAGGRCGAVEGSAE